jgi:hypothetical protein
MGGSHGEENIAIHCDSGLCPPGQQRDWPHGFNFYFGVQDPTDPTQWALYLYGTAADMAVEIPLPERWSVTDHVTHTLNRSALPNGTARLFMFEKNENYQPWRFHDRRSLPRPTNVSALPRVLRLSGSHIAVMAWSNAHPSAPFRLAACWNHRSVENP